MINLILASLALLGPATDSAVAEAPPLKIWINNNRGFKPGQPVKVQIETGKTGYLLVLHFSPRGEVSVLFPISPTDDALVQGDRRYEVRDGDGSVSFVASGSGPGLIYSALAEDPWQLESVTLNGAWDYGTLTIPRDTKDPEADLTAIVQRLSSPRGFDYDVLDYAVFGDRGGDASPPPSWWSPAYYDGCYCGYGPSAIYVGFGLSWGYAGWPWYWGFTYPAPYGYYGYYPGWGYGYPYYPYYPGWGYGHGHGGYYYPYNKLVGRSRGYQVNPARPGPHGRGRGTARGESVVNPGEGVFSDANAPARRARGGSDRSGGRGAPEARPASNGNGSNGGGARGSDPTTRSSGGDRARPRDGGTRSRPAGRSGYSTSASVAPNVEQARPVNRSRGEWVRVDDMTPSPARRAASGDRIAANAPGGRVDVPPARRAYRPEAPRTREVFQSRPSTGGGWARAAGGGEPRAMGGGQARAVERGRGDARPSGGNRGGSTPSYAAPRSGGRGNVAAPRSFGGGGGRGGFSGGGGRARGRP